MLDLFRKATPVPRTLGFAFFEGGFQAGGALGYGLSMAIVVTIASALKLPPAASVALAIPYTFASLLFFTCLALDIGSFPKDIDIESRPWIGIMLGFLISFFGFALFCFFLAKAVVQVRRLKVKREVHAMSQYAFGILCH